MYIELIELLRCPQPHEESWLVAALEEVDGRVVIRARLGCPLCSREYPVVGGVVEMRPDPAPPSPTGAGLAVSGSDDPWRLAGLLDLQAPASVAVLQGETAALASELSGIFTGGVVAVNPPHTAEPRERLLTVLSDGSLPLRTGTADGVAIAEAEDALVADATRVLRTGGRLLAPAAACVPAGMRVLARDESHWVGESEWSGAPLRIARGR